MSNKSGVSLTVDDSRIPSPRISVIVAVFNAEKTLQHCIDSIAGQVYRNIELIVVDGGSSDRTVEIICANGSRVAAWLSEPDTGVYNAWNKGLRLATGDWICFLGADDYFWSESVLVSMVERLNTVSLEIRLVYGQVMLLSSEGLPLYPIGEPWSAIRDRFLQVMCIPHPGLLHRRSLFEEHGGFDESFRIGGDYEMMLRDVSKAAPVFVQCICVGMRQGGISSSPENAVAAMLEARKAQRMHGMRWPGRHWISALLRVYFRMILWRLVGEKNARRFIDIGRRMRGLPPYWTRT